MATNGSQDRRQSSPNRGGRGQGRHFTKESYNRLLEGARRGGQNSHQSDQGGGTSSRSQNTSRGRNQESDRDFESMGNDRVLSILDTYTPEIQEEIRDHFKNELRPEIVQEVFDTVHERLDEAENEFVSESSDFDDDDSMGDDQSDERSGSSEMSGRGQGNGRSGGNVRIVGSRGNSGGNQRSSSSGRGSR